MSDEEIDNQAWKILKSYLESASAKQWHIYAVGSNYDDNRRELQWLIDNPNIEKATALLIYWNLGAAWYVQFSSKEEMSEPQQRTFDLLKLIEERYANKFYTIDNIWFDPLHSHGGRPDDYPELPVKRPIPPIMLQPTQGREFIDVENHINGYDDGVPDEIGSRLWALYK